MMSRWGFGLVALAACSGKSSGQDDAAVTTNFDAAADARMIDAMASIDAPELDFSCVGNPAPTMATDPIAISGGIAELSLSGTTPQLTGLDGATVTGCKPGETNCTSGPAQFGTVTTPTTAGTAGSFAFTGVATGGTPYGAYLRITKQGDRQTLSWPTEPFTADFAMYGAVVFNSSAFALITIGLGVNQSAQNGDLGLIVVDCANRAVTDTANLSFSITQGGQPVQGTTTFDVGTVNASIKGSFFIFNVPGGASGNQIATDVVVTYKGVTPPIMYRTRTLGMVASATSQTVVRPGYL